MSSETIAALQMHHSRMTALMHYGRQPSHFPNVIPTQQDAMAFFSIQFHHFFQLSSEAFPYFYQLFMGNSLPLIHQPTRVASTRALLYGKKLPSTSESVSLHHLQQYLQVELEADSSQSHGPGPGPRPSMPSMPPRNPLLLLLREFLGMPEAEFKTPEQQVALYYMLKGTPNLSIILPTAGGKSTLFLLAASLHWANTTLIMTPLLALKEDLAARAKDLGIPHSIWEDQHEKTTPICLVLASIDSVQNPHFMEWVQCLAASGQLDRVIFDEAHLLPSSRDFRSSFKYTRQLGLVRIQKIYISATLPQHIFDDLTEMLSIPPHLTVRANINRPNIYYSVRRLSDPPNQSDLEPFQIRREHYDEIMRFISFIDIHQPPEPRFASGTRPLVPSQTHPLVPSQTHPLVPSVRPRKRRRSTIRTIIYFRSIRELDHFQEVYYHHVAPYYSDLPKKADYLKSFLDGHKHILACTSAISAGFDFTDIDLVIHYDLPWGLTDWVQQSGRLSRDPRKVGHSVIFTNKMHYHDPKDLEEGLIQQFINQDGCRRALINALYNDQIDQFCQPDDLPCDFCHGRALVLEQTSALTIAKNQLVAYREAKLKGFIDLFQKRCIGCTMASMNGFNDYWRHKPFEIDISYKHKVGPKCPNWLVYSGMVKKYQNYWKNWKSPSINSCHYACLLPTRFCRQWYPSDPSDSTSGTTGTGIGTSGTTGTGISGTTGTGTTGTGTTGKEAHQPGKNHCPGENPISYWSCFIQELGAWDWIDPAYQPDQFGKHVSHNFWFKKMLEVDEDFFQTEAIYGVLGFYSWALRAEEEKILVDSDDES
jgi:superfamily II DNA helicase RecQ